MYRLDAIEALEKLYKDYVENASNLKTAKIVSLRAYKQIMEEKNKIKAVLIAKRKQRLTEVVK